MTLYRSLSELSFSTPPSPFRPHLQVVHQDLVFQGQWLGGLYRKIHLVGNNNELTLTSLTDLMLDIPYGSFEYLPLRC